MSISEDPELDTIRKSNALIRHYFGQVPDDQMTWAERANEAYYLLRLFMSPWTKKEDD